MAKEAAPFQQDGGWAMRRRVNGQNLYVSRQKSQKAAREAMKKKVTLLEQRGKPKSLGPFKTTLAQALQDMALECLPLMKGADQEARRINAYLRAAGLQTLKVTALDPKHKPTKRTKADEEPTAGSHYFEVELEDSELERRVPRGLGKHRQAQADQTRAAEAVRDRLARMMVADIQRYHVQDYFKELAKVRSPATLQLERAVLRKFFNYARHIWHWSAPAENPAAGLKMPKLDNARDRVMSEEEQQRLDEAIQLCRNDLVGPTMTLLTETAMRCSEPLEYARWADVDWERKLLRLRDSKTDKRNVPLSPRAIHALQELARLNQPAPDQPIIRMSYNALAAAWRRACERAGVPDLHLHDLRHTAASRMALKTGNVFLVKALTGHKTMAQLERYVNVKASDVVAVMHAQEVPAAAVPSEKAPSEKTPPERAPSKKASAEQGPVAVFEQAVVVTRPCNVIRGAFPQWRRA